MLFFALTHRDDAAVGYFADYVLELNRRMDNAEVMVQAVFHVVQDAFADGGGDVGDGDVAGEGVGF